MSRLDDILDEFDAEINVGVAWPKAKQQIKDLFLELIGEDSPGGHPWEDGGNAVLKYLRQKVGEL